MTESNNWQPEPDKLSEIKKQLELFQNNASNINMPLQQNEIIQSRCARLIVLLVQIENELSKIEKTVEALWHTGYTTKNETIKSQASNNLQTIKKLQLKIRSARLNLNYHLM